MKPIKLRLLTALLILTNVFNLVHAQTKVAVKAGLNFANIKMEDRNGVKAETQSKQGMQFGLVVDIPIAGNFYLQPGALYSNKGFKQETGGFYGTTTGFDVTVSYLEVPLNILYKIPAGKSNLLLGAGPYAAYGTGGKWKSDTDPTIGDIRIENRGKVDFKNDGAEGEFGNYLYGKPIDYGLNFLAGYEFHKQLSIQFNAQLGLANLEPGYGDLKPQGSLKNHAFTLSLGYKIP